MRDRDSAQTRGMVMRIARVAALILAIAVMAIADQSTISVKEVPPEPFPAGTCNSDVSGYVGIVKAGKWEMHLTDKQLGEYVRVRLSQGYSVSLYPQSSGKVYAINTCESRKP
jgi:hypothetical protein